jgi:hypothetical protein
MGIGNIREATKTVSQYLIVGGKVVFSTSADRVEDLRYGGLRKDGNGFIRPFLWIGCRGLRESVSGCMLQSQEEPKRGSRSPHFSRMVEGQKYGSLGNNGNDFSWSFL